jgi:hypothetical protein
LKQGIIMELQGRKAIVMTPSGEFIQIKKVKPEWKVGEQIQFSPQSMPQWALTMRWTAAAAALFLIFMVGIPWMTAGTSKAVAAYVTLDINPSIELSINEDEEVIGVDGINQDGEKLLDSLDLVGDDLIKATSSIMVEAQKQGFISSDGGDVVITTVIVEGKEQLENEINKQIAEVIKTDIKPMGQQVKATLLIGNKKLRDEAQKMNLSSGQYAIYLAAKEQGIDIQIDALQGNSIHELAKQHKGLRKLIDRGINKDALIHLTGKKKDRSDRESDDQDKEDDKNNKDKKDDSRDDDRGKSNANHGKDNNKNSNKDEDSGSRNDEKEEDGGTISPPVDLPTKIPVDLPVDIKLPKVQFPFPAIKDSFPGRYGQFDHPKGANGKKHKQKGEDGREDKNEDDEDYENEDEDED